MDRRKIVEQGYNWYSELLRAFSFNGRTVLPAVIIWEPTMKCNLKCVMCPWYGPGGKLPDNKGELTLEEMKAAIDNIKSAYRLLPFLPFIAFTGGEPFLRKDFLDILAYLKKEGFKYSITSNFTIPTKDILMKLAELMPSDLHISLDGPEDIHDKIRGAKGTFKKSVENIKFIRSYKNGKNILLRLNCVMSEANLNCLGDMIKIAKELNADLEFQHLFFLDEKHEIAQSNFSKRVFGQDFPKIVGNMKLTQNQVDILKKLIPKLVAEAKELNVRLSFLPELRTDELDSYYFNLDNYTHSGRCSYVWGSVRIDNQGNLYPCYFYSYGNLRENSFKRIINSKRARFFRETLKKHKLFPGCIRCCKI